VARLRSTHAHPILLARKIVEINGGCRIQGHPIAWLRWAAIIFKDNFDGFSHSVACLVGNDAVIGSNKRTQRGDDKSDP
jgi:hypothetical protein